MPEKVAIVGAGLIGRAFAISFARGGYEVALYDPARGAVPAALALVPRSLDDLEARGLLPGRSAAAVRARIRGVPRLADALDGAVHVQENGPETLEAKRAIFAEMDPLAPPDAVLASSSSGIVASKFTAELRGRARCLVAHPANPPYLIPIVELVPAPWTDPAVVDRTHDLMTRVGQAPIRVNREVQGFVLNRLQAALLNEAFRLVEDGYATPEDVDITVREGLGLRWSFMGPFETIDLNAPGGVTDYARRYGPLLHDLAVSQADPRRWTDRLVRGIEAARAALLPRDRLGERQAWRDRRLMALAVHKAEARKAIDEGG